MKNSLEMLTRETADNLNSPQNENKLQQVFYFCLVLRLLLFDLRLMLVQSPLHTALSSLFI